MKEKSGKENSTEPTIDPLRISTGAVNGPVVIFYGPARIGKTVALLRLFMYLSGEFDMTANLEFRHDVKYLDAIKRFNKAQGNINKIAPNPNSDDEFLLFDVTKGGRSFCQVLEAPGEHFFHTEKKEELTSTSLYLPYFNQILAADYRKVVVFFFEIGMFTTDIERERYVNRVADLISQRLNSKKDRIILLCNKCDLQGKWFDKGKPKEKEFRENLYARPYFKKLRLLLEKGYYGRIYFVCFSGGSYQEPDEKNMKYILDYPKCHYPDALWEAVHNCLTGEWIDLSILKIFPRVNSLLQIISIAAKSEN